MSTAVLDNYWIDLAPEQIAQPFPWMRPDGSGARKSVVRFYGCVDMADPWLMEIICPAKEQKHVLTADVPTSLGFVKDVFDLNTSELAHVMLVSRPTIYSWVAGDQEVKQENRQRLTQLQDFASSWRSFSKNPIGALVRENIDGANSSLLELLSLVEIPHEKVIKSLKIIADLITSHEASRRNTHHSMRELAREHGLQPISDEKVRQNLRHMFQRRRSR